MNVVKHKLGSPLFWSTVSSVGTQALSFVTFAILARLLGAPTFGLVALSAVVIDLLLVISSAGINEAVVQRPVLEEETADTAFWANLALGFVFCITTIIAAPVIAEVFGDIRLTPIVMALASIFAITPLGAIHAARLTRELRFRSLAMRNLFAAVSGAAIGLPLALEGFGVWALVGQRIGSALALVFISWASTRWIPRLRFDPFSFKKLLHYGGQIGVSSTLNQINIRAAEIISGALVGAVAVAFIRAGSRIVEVLNQVTYMPFQQIAIPLLARSAADRADLRATYLKLSQLSAFVMFPLFFGALAMADELVAVVFGHGWAPVANAIRIFACAVIASQVNNLIISALSSAGDARTILKWTSAQILLGLILTIGAHRWGWEAMLIAGVARAYVILPFGLYLLRKRTGIAVGEIFSSLRPALLSAAAMIGIIAAGKSWLLPELTPLSALFIWVPGGATVYLAAYACQHRQTARYLHEVLRLARKAASQPLLKGDR